MKWFVTRAGQILVDDAKYAVKYLYNPFPQNLFAKGRG